MSLSINNSKYMSSKNCFQYIGNFFFTKKFMQLSYVTRNALDHPKTVKCSVHIFREFCGLIQKSLSLKMVEKYFLKN